MGYFSQVSIVAHVHIHVGSCFNSLSNYIKVSQITLRLSGSLVLSHRHVTFKKLKYDHLLNLSTTMYIQ